MTIAYSALSGLPQPLTGQPGGLLVVKTGEGNWAKLLVRAAQRKRATGDPVSVLYVQRLVTYPADVRRKTVAEARELYVFPGFRLDLDLGQPVPEGTGEDLLFVLESGKPVLQAAAGAELFVLTRPLVSPSAPAKAGPANTGPVRPVDFSGTYKLQADGRWSGELVLKAAESGEVTGTYRSEQSGESYDISGRVGNPASHVQIRIRLPRTEQTLDGYLWSRQRRTISGVGQMEGHPFGFLAQRTD